MVCLQVPGVVITADDVHAYSAGARATAAGVPTADDDVDTIVCLQIPEPQQQLASSVQMIALSD